MNILVFGVTGEIGSRIARLSRDAGHHVTGVSRGQNTRAIVDLSGIEIISGNKNDERFIQEQIATRKIDHVVDSVPSIESANLYQRHLKQVQNFLFCSSTGTYVPLQYLPADELHPWRERTPVNFSSISDRDSHILHLHVEKGFPATILRPTNIIGEHRVPLDLWGGRSISFFKKLKAGEPITIAPCGQILVQPGYNWDLASAFVKAMQHPDRIPGEIFIISCKHAITLEKYLRTTMDFLGSRSEIRHAAVDQLSAIHPEATKEGMEFLLEHMCLDISKAERILGYAPTHTAEQGLLKSLQWCESTALF